MRTLIKMVFICMLIVSSSTGQTLRVTISEVGSSAVSVNTLMARTYHFLYPVTDCAFDSTSGQLIVSAHEKKSVLPVRGQLVAISSANDSVSWVNSSVADNVLVNGGALLSSEGTGTARYNKRNGSDELRYNGRIVQTFKSGSLGLSVSAEGQQVQCVDLTSGSVLWNCTAGGSSGWQDTKWLNDSVLLIASDGIHALHARKGLLWSHPAVNSIEALNNWDKNTLLNRETMNLNIQPVATSLKDNMVSQLGSNILIYGQKILFGGIDKLIAINFDGKKLWETSLQGYPVSSYRLLVTNNSLMLVNTGAAWNRGDYVKYGKPFVLVLDPAGGSILDKPDPVAFDGLSDFMISDNSLLVAGSDAIVQVERGKELKNVLFLDPSYGNFVGFINGNNYYKLKEGYFVKLNSIDKTLYYLSDNNKVYAIERANIKYEYNFNDLYRFDKSHKGKNFLVNRDRTLVTDNNNELLYGIRLTGKSVIGDKKIYFVNDNRINSVNLGDIR
jgi:hypothetical protein